MGIKKGVHGVLTLTIAVGLGIALAGCQGGAVYFEGGAAGQVSVNENTAAPVWTAVARVEGASGPANITYRITGPDAEQFVINANGELSFKLAADFEHPQDADNNNEYRVDIEASANTKTAVQTLRVNVVDVKTPQVALVRPKPFENVGKGDELEVATVVRVFDAESNTPLQGLEVKQNFVSLQQDRADPSLWKGTMVVPENGVEFPLSAVLADGTELNANGKLLNKRNSLSPSFLGVNPGAYLIFVDPERQMIGKLNLSNMYWTDYLFDNALSNVHFFDFNSSWETLYATYKPQASEELMAFNVASRFPLFFHHSDCLPGAVANITYDITNKRTLALLPRQEKNTQRFKVLSFAVDQNTGFIDAKQNLSTPCTPAQQNVVWDIPAGVIKGVYKDFNYYRLGKLYVLADERMEIGSTYTAIQVFSESGERRFEVRLGADISNMAIDNNAGIIYVAENHSSFAGTIKAINITTGQVTQLVKSISGNSPGAYTQLRIDNVNKKLYIADDVSDAFFVVDLATGSLSELKYQSPIILPME